MVQGVQIPSNLEIFKTGISKVLDDAVKIRFESPVILKNTDYSPNDWFMESQMTTWLKNNHEIDVISWKTPVSIIDTGGTVIKQAGSRSDTLRLKNPFILEYRPLLLRVEYENKTTQSDSLQRHIIVELYLKATQASRILFADTYRNRNSDKIAVQDIKNVENPEIQFTVGDRPVSLLKRLFEPVLVSVLTATIIYFFYAFRSK